jgi:hypothetical protein
MNHQTISKRWIPWAFFGLMLLLPVASEACVVVYLDAWEDSGYVYGSVFVEDYYDFGSCYYDVIGEWTYWEHSYDAAVYIESPTQNTASDSDSMNDVAYGGGSAGADALISTAGDHGPYTVGLSTGIVCTVEGPIVFEEEEPQVQSCIVPDGETNTFDEWHTDGRGGWESTLAPSGTSFQGRIVTERDPGGGGPDTCWWEDSNYMPFESITSGTWPVGANNVWGNDYVGYYSWVVTYYREEGRAPCGTTFPQRMEISCPSGPDRAYQTNTLGGSMTSTTVTSTRLGSSEPHTWP